jgi:hypothetical protein
MFSIQRKNSSRPRSGTNFTRPSRAAAIGSVFFCDYFDNSVKSSEEMEGLLQLPALATIPNQSASRLLFMHRSRLMRCRNE